MGPLRSIVPTVALLAATAAAQAFVVAPAGGQFTTLVAAAAAVPDGAILLVRQGTYGGFSVTGKGLRVLADPGVTITSTIHFANLAANQPVVLRGLSWTRATGDWSPVRLQACAGPVVLEDLVVPGSVCGPLCIGPADAIHADTCAQLLLRGCTVLGASTVTGCNTVVESCTLTGENWNCGYPGGFLGRSALTVQNGALQVAGATVATGGDGLVGGGTCIGAPPGSALLLAGSVEADVRDAALVPGGPDPWPFPLTSGGQSIEQSGAVVARVSPRVTGANGGPPTSNLPLLTGPLPGLAGSSAVPGGVLTVGVRGEPGDVVIVLLGLVGPPVTTPGITAPFWLAPTQFVWHAFGTQPAAGAFAASLSVPNQPTLLGASAAWQAVASGPLTGLQASNPTIAFVR